MRIVLFVLAALGLLTAGCFQPTKATVYGYLTEWNDNVTTADGIYMSYADGEGNGIVFDRVDENGFLRGTCTVDAGEIVGPCVAALRGTGMLLVYPSYPGASPVDPDQVGGYQDGEDGWSVAHFGRAGQSLSCRSVAHYLDWGQHLRDMAWGQCGGITPMVLTAESNILLIAAPAEIVPEPQDPDPIADEDDPVVDERTVEERIEELKRMLDKGLITQEEYDDKKTQLLEEL